MSESLVVLYLPPMNGCRSVIIYRSLPDMPRESRDAWSLWFERMGIDPSGVPLSATIVSDDKARTITYPRVRRRDGGEPDVDYDGLLVSETVTIQLEAPALPFPRTPF